MGHHGVWGKGNGTRPLNMYDSPTHQSVIADLTGRSETFFARIEDPVKNGLRVLDLPKHNGKEAWRDEPP